jgi:DNA repair photolyase
MRPHYREEPCRTALNPVRGMPFRWSLNPYMGCVHRCTFCYVRAYELRAERPSGEGYGRSIRVKVNVAEVLAAELARPSWRRELVAVGTATDPYQPAEGRYRLTRACLACLTDSGTPFSLVTRSPLIVRDRDILAQAARLGGASVTFSVPTLDEEVWRATEPGTAPPRQRLRALARLRGEGIEAGVALAPLLPGLSDRPDQLAQVLQAAREAGASHLWASMLHLRPGVREHFLAALARDWPQELPRYERLYARGAYVPRREAEAVLGRVTALRRRLGLPGRQRTPPTPASPPRQLSLPLAPSLAAARR